MKTQHLLLAALMATCLPAMADAPAPLAAVRPFAAARIAPLVVSHRVVKNAPYSAQVVTEKVQNLPDGNQIAHHATVMTYRDSAGRTRNEISNANGEVRAITLRDPAGSSYILHPQDKTATQLGGSPEQVKQARKAARARIAELRKEGKLPATGAGGEAIIVKRIERVDGGAQGKVQEEVRMHVRTQEGLRGELPPLLAGAFGDHKWARNATTRDLGTREFDGVKAEGKIRSYEIPAGEVGNRNPIVVTHETWHSPELQVAVYTKHSDPRHGDSIYKLENIKREEPAASLFTVPGDYTVKTRTVRVHKAEEKK
ncbi:hypothetical protein [Massilia cavernae]|uniref:Uncharacterized protein n=1 Tax=Massilia cavernae TaxID=2320864 RepID=A0A418XFR1_9BURK|nr:hypothetical protein [Massilia cavernae]RJG11295.1 hypothetical protein D3872_20145 [Massilia cavernae]